MLNQFKWPYLNRLKIQIHQFLKWIDSDSDSHFFWIKTELIQFWIDSRLNLTNTGKQKRKFYYDTPLCFHVCHVLHFRIGERRDFQAHSIGWCSGIFRSIETDEKWYFLKTLWPLDPPYDWSGSITACYTFAQKLSCNAVFSADICTVVYTSSLKRLEIRCWWERTINTFSSGL